MIAWTNFGVLVISSLLFLYLYLKSVRPAVLEKRIGETAYRKCTLYRFLSGAFVMIAVGNYVLYVFYPLPMVLPDTFPWSWSGSVLIAVLIAVPSGYLFYRGMKDAGEETMIARKEHTLYGGIYDKIRQPQAAGELPLWRALAFALNSPFLALFSFVWIPIFIIMCRAEEKDLIIRYGQAYDEYRKRTGFIFPRIR